MGAIFHSAKPGKMVLCDNSHPDFMIFFQMIFTVSERVID